MPTVVISPVLAAAKRKPRRIVYAEAENECVLRAIQVVIEENLAIPIVLGREAAVKQRIDRIGLRLTMGLDFKLIDPEFHWRHSGYFSDYHKLASEKGVAPQDGNVDVCCRPTLVGAMLVRKGEAEGLICGTSGVYAEHLHCLDLVIGKRAGVKEYAAMSCVILSNRVLFIVDTYVNFDPTAEQLAEITTMAAAEVRRFGIVPKVALLSHSNFGTSDGASAVKMRQTLALVLEQAPDLEIDGEMHGDCALDAAVRRSVFPESMLSGEANLLVMPNIDAANISCSLLKAFAEGTAAIGPILLGAAKPVHILTPTASVRRIVNMTALAVVEANNLSTRRLQPQALRRGGQDAGSVIQKE